MGLLSLFRALFYVFLTVCFVLGVERVLSPVRPGPWLWYLLYGTVAMLAIVAVRWIVLGVGLWRRHEVGRHGPFVFFIVVWTGFGAWHLVRALRPTELYSATLGAAGMPVPRVGIRDQMRNAFLDVLPGGFGHLARAGEIVKLELVSGCEWHQLERVGTIGICRRENGSWLAVFHPVTGGPSQVIEGPALWELMRSGELAHVQEDGVTSSGATPSSPTSAEVRASSAGADPERPGKSRSTAGREAASPRGP